MIRLLSVLLGVYNQQRVDGIKLALHWGEEISWLDRRELELERRERMRARGYR